MKVGDWDRPTVCTLSAELPHELPQKTVGGEAKARTRGASIAGKRNQKETADDR